MTLAVFGIESDGLNLAVNLLILFLVVIYLALAYWTYADARRRIADPMLIGCAAAAAILFPFVGAIVYMIVRPPEYLDDVRERELEMQAAEARMHAMDYHLCPHCDYEVKSTSCAARTACASSRTRAATARSRWTPSGSSARTARPRSPASPGAPQPPPPALAAAEETAPFEPFAEAPPSS